MTFVHTSKKGDLKVAFFDEYGAELLPLEVLIFNDLIL